MKRILSVILALALTLSVAPGALTVLAAEDAEGGGGTSGVSAEGGSDAAEPTEETDGADGDGDIVKGDVTVLIELAKETASTGETVPVRIYAYNDNPNATALANISVSLASGKAYPVHSDGTPYGDTESLSFDISLESGSASTATTVTAEWTKQESGGKLDFTLPAGASVSFDFPLKVDAGYDESVTATLDYTYTVAESDGEVKSGDDPKTITWTGDAKWANFAVTQTLDGAAGSVVVYDGGLFWPDEIDYRFSAENNTPASVGYVYTNRLVLEGTLTLPEGLDVPEDAVFEREGDDRFTLKTDTASFFGFSLGAGAACKFGDVLEGSVSGNEISFKLELVPTGDLSATWNPLDNVNAALYLDSFGEVESFLTGDSSKKVVFTAKLSYGAVTAPDKVNEINTDTRQTGFAANGELNMDKRLDQIWRVEDAVNMTGTPVAAHTRVPVTLKAGKYDIRRGDVMEFTITLSNNTDYDIFNKEVTDYLIKGLVLAEEYEGWNELRTGDLRSFYSNSGLKLIYSLNGTTRQVIPAKGNGYQVGEAVSGAEKGLGTFVSGADDLKFIPVTFTIPELKAHETVEIRYTCIVDYTEAIEDLYHLGNSSQIDALEPTYKYLCEKGFMNIAVLDGKGSDVQIPAEERNGPGSLEKIVISRYTRLQDGSSYAFIYYNPENDTYGCSGNIPGLLGTGSPTQDQLKEALHELNAGDRIEYLITLNTGKTYNSQYFNPAFQVIDDSPFSSGPYESATTIGDWKYFAAGCDTYCYGAVYNPSSAAPSVYRETAYDPALVNRVLNPGSSIGAPPSTVFRYGDLARKLDISPSVKGEFDIYATSTKTLEPLAEYRQTTVLLVPGDNSKPSEQNTSITDIFGSVSTNGNYQFQFFKQSTRWYMSYPPQAMLTGNGVNISITHSVADQLYISTGVLSTSQVADADNITAGEIKTKSYAGEDITDIERRADENEDNHNTVRLSDDEVVVNYVAIYNQSNKAMDLSQYTLSVLLPQGFTWLGFTGINGYDGSSYHFDTIQNTSPSSLFRSSPTAIYRFTNFNGNSFPLSFDNNSTTGSGVVEPHLMAANIGEEYRDIIYYTDLGGLERAYASQTSGAITLKTAGESIPANTVAVFAYAAKASSEIASYYANMSGEQAKVTFGVSLRANNNKYIPQPTIEIEVYPSMSPYAPTDAAPNRYVYNNWGTVQSYLNFTRSAGDYTVSAENGETYHINGVPADPLLGNYPNPYTLYSFVNLTPIHQDYLKLEVEKEVFKNVGYRNFGPFDGYIYNYVLHDGLHRTVDGTVTWNYTVSNTGERKAGNQTLVAQALNYGVLVDTIDQPYTLEKISFKRWTAAGKEDTAADTSGDLPYRYTDADGNSQMILLHPEAVNVSFTGGSDRFEAVIATVEAPGTEADGKQIKIRVTKKTLGYTLGYGADVRGGRNTHSTQYVIELSRLSGDGWTLTPELSWKGEDSFGDSSVTFAMTFRTDESILTNYNSFAVAIMDAEKYASVEVNGGALKTNYSNAHNGDLYSSASISAAALSEEGEFATSDGTVTGDPTIVEYSDWTDTSYTYGKKTMTVLDEEGKDVDSMSLNTVDDGNMLMPNVAPGTRIRTDLMVESILYESDQYEYFDKLVIYDLFGVEASADTHGSRSPYIVDFSSIEVRKSAGPGDPGIYKLGEDYEIWYTFDDYVTVEHHPISPVNTLYYAADLSKIGKDETGSEGHGEWIKYDPDKGADGTRTAKDGTVEYARGIKIVLKADEGYDDNSVGSLTGRALRDGIKKSESGTARFYVTFESTVRDDVGSAKPYPNILAYTADVVDVEGEDGLRRKHIMEDTTADSKLDDSTFNLELIKHVEIEGKDLTEMLSEEEFAFLIVKTAGSTLTEVSLTSIENIDAIAYGTIKPGEIGSIMNFSLIYTKSSDDYADMGSFFDNAHRYYIIEVTPGYTVSAEKVTEKSNYSSNITKSSIAFAPNGIVLNRLEGNPRGEEIRKLFSETERRTLDAWYFTPNLTPGRNTLVLRIKNAADGESITIRKVDPEGNTIFQLSKFKIWSGENTLWFTGSAEKGYDVVAEGTDGAVNELEVNGIAELRGVLPGTYEIEETQAPEGYTGLSGKQKATVKLGDTSIEVDVVNTASSKPVYASLTIKKVDEASELITAHSAKFMLFATRADAKALKNPLTFTWEDGAYVYDAGGDITTLETTDGVLQITGLPVIALEGTEIESVVYYLVETDAPEGYAGLTEPFPIMVSRSHLEQERAIVNEFVSATLTVNKIDSGTKEAVTSSPAVFTLTDEEGNEVRFSGIAGSYAYDADGAVTELETDAAGKLVLTGLPKGSYTLTEVGVPTGYKLGATGGTAITVANNTAQTVEVENERDVFALNITKYRRSIGSKKSYPMNGVSFTLYMLEEDGDTLTEVAGGVTSGQGALTVENLDWSRTYYLYEELPDGYTQGNTDNLADGFISSDGAVTLSGGEGRTALPSKLIKIEPLDKLQLSEDGGWEYGLDVYNVSQPRFGGSYASVSYKTISNEEVAKKYGITPSVGYSYFYTDADYGQGLYNYVPAVVPGDVVTYTLNIANVSEYEFKDLVIIDRMPRPDDTGVVNLGEERDSQFTVFNGDTEFEITIDGKKLDESNFTVTFAADKEFFTEGDFNNTTTWLTFEEAKESGVDISCFRVAFAEGFIMEPGSKLEVKYNGVIRDAQVGQIAWNNFAYRYTASGGPDGSEEVTVDDSARAISGTAKANPDGTGVVLTPEPAKVGVFVNRVYAEVGATKTYKVDEESKDRTPKTFKFLLAPLGRTGGALYEMADGSIVPIPESGIEINVTVGADSSVDIPIPRLWFAQPGEYKFTLSETAGDPDGGRMDYSENVYGIVVNADADAFVKGD